MKSYEEIMEILEAFDLTGSFRAAAELAGCSHHTVEVYVARRDVGLLPSPSVPVVRVKLIDPFLPKLEEWVERSQGKIRGDVVFDKLGPLGFEGSERTVRCGFSTRTEGTEPRQPVIVGLIGARAQAGLRSRASKVGVWLMRRTQ